MASEMFCTSCGHTGRAKKETPGSFIFEIVLWLCFLIPGIIYSFWRITHKYSCCAKCGNRSVIPSDSPIAIQHKQSIVRSGQ